MSTISLRLPESLHAQARVIAEREGISINQLIATSLAEKLAALMTVEYLEARAARGSRDTFRRILAAVPDRPTVPGDER
ncbi:MAG: toxin-antitoxin system HicB family antitoxin [Gemmatimonadetes bacterium]|nr:toxin-antitoxin system HicB family antitoxin [Gemmatimonadota bacterium]